MKNISNKVFSFLTLIGLIIFSKNVLAYEKVTINNDGTTTSVATQSCKSHYYFCWLNKNNNRAPGIQGIRVTAYTESGVKISDSVDFTNDYGVIERINSSLFYVGSSSGNKSRIDYINGAVIAENEVKSPNLKYASFPDFIKTTTSDVDLLGTLDTDTILRSINYCSGSYASYCSINSAHYFVVEPLTILFSRYTKYHFYGTYYELLQMTGGFRPFTESGQGVNYFLPGNIALSLYITNPGNNFTAFYNKVGLSLPNSNVNQVKDMLNSFGTSLSYVSPILSITGEVENGFGVGVSKITTESVDNPPINPECTTEIDYGNCERDRIVLETKNCPYDNTSSYIMSWNGDGECRDSGSLLFAQIVCDEKYYIATFGVRDAFKPIDGSKILAGSYFPINGPTVYHKKNCSFIDKSDSEIASAANAACTYTDWECANVSCTSKVPVCKLDDACYSNKYGNAITSRNNLRSRYNTLVASKATHATNDSVGILSLDLNFSSYDLESISSEKVTEVDTSNNDYYYKNTFVYDISNNTNRYIGLHSSINEMNGSLILNKVVDFQRPMATTPINIQEGIYNYLLDYYDVFKNNTLFISNLTGATIVNFKYVCPYEINRRSNNIIKTYCTTDCDNPNDIFNLVKLKMIYRPINLRVPFPGLNYTGPGTNREPGKNWSEENISIIITEDVYEEDPIYVIDLDASKMGQIREYNKTHAYDDFNLKCTLGFGTECISEFLRNESIVPGGILTEGTCKEAVSASEFYTCAD